MTDVDQVKRAIAGDSAARAELWRRYRRAVAAVALSYRPRAELEDLVQETALAWVRALSTLRDPDRFEPWLMQIARNVARAGARRDRSSLPTSASDPDSIPAVAMGSHDDSLARALARLPDDFREVLLLRSVEGHSQRRISELLGLPETTIETRLVRARRMLRDRLEADESPRPIVRERVPMNAPRKSP